MKLRNYYQTVLAVSLLVTALSCHDAKKVETQSPLTDSVAVESNIEDHYLPDTMYASANKLKWSIDAEGNSESLLKGKISDYESVDILTFRKNPMRNADFGGVVKGTPDTIEVAWKFDTYYNTEHTRFGVWGGGSGWTGQPLYLSKSNEIILSSLCSRTYFIDFTTGKASRSSVDVHNTIKGTPSIDPFFKNLYVGQGIPNHLPIGRLVINLNKAKESQFIDRDSRALRHWYASDASPIEVGGYLFWPGEDGSLYKYSRKQGHLKLVSALRYTINGSAPGIENSLCAYRNYGWFGDNYGSIICVNLNTMKPVWYYDNHDDIDGTIVCEVENNTPYIYCGCEVDKQGMSGTCYFVKLNGLTGEQVWVQTIPCNRIQIGEKVLDGGMYCTPLLGRGDAKGLIFANICRNGADGKGKSSGQLVAFNTTDGKIVYTTRLNQFAWSSPIGYMNEKGEQFIFTGDSGGMVYLIRAKNGELLYKHHVASNFESSPIAIGNTAVIGSRQNGIYKFVIK